MNLMRWFRKNNKKIMAVVVIVLMFGFVGGTALQRFLEPGRTGLGKPVAYFEDEREITNYDLLVARQELETLKMLGADVILRSIPVPIFRMPDLRALLLGELLFSDRRASPVVIGRIKQLIRTNEYRISGRQINDIYRGSMPSHIYWLLLEKEADLAGIKVSSEDAGRYLASIYANNPEITRGARYSQVIEAIANRQGIAEDKILAAFGKLWAVFEYAKLMCSSEDITAQQTAHNISRGGETIDVEFVRFDSSLFSQAADEPAAAAVSTHFDKYKEFFAGDISEENPWGFGYKLRDRAGLEYIVVKLDDVSTTVAEPTQEDAEEYYLKNRNRFAIQVPSDPNDPNSQLTDQVRSYSEVADNIIDLIKLEKVNSKAEGILQESKTLTETAFESTDTDLTKLSAEQFRQMAGDYKTATQELEKKHKVKVYTGRTGLLSATDMRADEYLGRMFVRGYGYSLVGLPQLVFAIDELGVSELGPFDAPKPRMYENIGPLRDVMERIMAVVRVTETEKASEPESLDQTFSKSTIELGQTADQAGEEVYSVRENVVQDLKKLSAMDTTKSKAEEFRELAIREGWDTATERFNELYGKSEANDVDPNAGVAEETASETQKEFSVQSLTNLRRISKRSLSTLAVQDRGSPEAQLSTDIARKEGKLRDLLYSLVPQDSNTISTVPLVIEFKPDMSYYCLKNVSVRRIDRDQYEQSKVMQIYREDVAESQSLAAVYFNPDNILERTDFRWVREGKEPGDSNSPVDSNTSTESNSPTEAEGGS